MTRRRHWTGQQPNGTLAVELAYGSFRGCCGHASKTRVASDNLIR